MIDQTPKELLSIISLAVSMFTGLLNIIDALGL